MFVLDVGVIQNMFPKEVIVGGSLIPLACVFVYCFVKEGAQLGCDGFGVFTKVCDKSANTISGRAQTVNDVVDGFSRVVAWRRAFITSLVTAAVGFLVLAHIPNPIACVYAFVFLSTAFHYFVENFYNYHLWSPVGAKIKSLVSRGR